MIKNLLKIILVFIVGAVAGIFSDQILWPYFIERPLFYQYDLDQIPMHVNETKQIVIQENTALQEAVGKTEKTVLGIKTVVKTGKTTQVIEGSGLIVTSDGLALSLAEVLPEGSSSIVYIDGRQTTFQVLKRDAKNNLVLLKISESNLPSVSFGDFGALRQGQRVFLVGTVFSGQNPKKIVNEGFIKIFDSTAIQTNMEEKKSVQGSPLFDIEARVVGLNLVDKEGKISAIPVSKIKAFAGF